MRKILFLDVDGVLNNDETFERKSTVDTSNLGDSETKILWMKEKIEPILVQRVNDIIEATGAEIVVSSSWRLHFESVEEMKFFFESVGIKKDSIIDKTEHYYPGMRFRSDPKRGLQIQDWIEKHIVDPHNLAFAILDDNGGMEHLHPRLIQTNERFGLTATEAQETIQLLSKKADEHLYFDWKRR